MTVWTTTARAVRPDTTIPGRVTEAGVRELALALGAADDDEADAWTLLGRAFQALTVQELGERLLDELMLQPPIPAGCEAMLRQMQDADHPPWVDLDVASDRFNLWYAHLLVHTVFPDRWPAPAITRVTVEVASDDPAARPPGKRSPPRDRTSFVGRLLAGRPGDNPITRAYGVPGDDEVEWAFDLIWGAEVSDRVKLDDAAAAEIGLQPGAVRVTIDAWLPPQWLGDLTEGQRWTATARVG